MSHNVAEIFQILEEEGKFLFKPSNLLQLFHERLCFLNTIMQSSSPFV